MSFNLCLNSVYKCKLSSRYKQFIGGIAMVHVQKRIIEPDRGDWAIEARGLVKNFGDNRAVDGVNLNVRAGTIYGVLGLEWSR